MWRAGDEKVRQTNTHVLNHILNLFVGTSAKPTETLRRLLLCVITKVETRGWE